MVELMPMYELERINEEKGKYWFSKGAKQFFKSRLPKYAYKSGNLAYFVSSEENPSGERRYSIRVMNLITGDVTTVGDFFKYESKEKAEQKLKGLL